MFKIGACTQLTQETVCLFERRNLYVEKAQEHHCHRRGNPTIEAVCSSPGPQMTQVCEETASHAYVIH